MKKNKKLEGRNRRLWYTLFLFGALILILFSRDLLKEYFYQRRIETIEKNFLDFERQIEPKLQIFFPDEHLREQIVMPFDMVRVNQKNPYRNHLTLKRKIRQKSYSPENPTYFYYSFTQPGFGQPVNNFATAYSAAERTVFLGKNFKASSIKELLLLYHELRHVVQDAHVRMKIDSPEAFARYMSFYEGHSPAEKPRLLLVDETTAYAYELEILNLLLDNQLRVAAEKGELIKPEIIIRNLKMGPKDEVLNVPLYFAPFYFPHGALGGNFSGAYVKKVAELYHNIGYRLFYITPEGRLREIQPENIK